jgi:hypothetical protein
MDHRLMRRMLLSATCAAFAVAFVAVCVAQKSDTKAPDSKRPKVTLRARPEYGIAPARIVLTAELEGGSDDFEEYYCPTVVWEFNDGSTSEASSDCAPYEVGKSKITRRYTKEHTYKRSGRIRVYFSLRHHDKEVTATGVNITVQPGGLDNSP